MHFDSLRGRIGAEVDELAWPLVGRAAQRSCCCARLPTAEVLTRRSALRPHVTAKHVPAQGPARS